MATLEVKLLVQAFRKEVYDEVKQGGRTTGQLLTKFRNIKKTKMADRNRLNRALHWLHEQGFVSRTVNKQCQEGNYWKVIAPYIEPDITKYKSEIEYCVSEMLDQGFCTRALLEMKLDFSYTGITAALNAMVKRGEIVVHQELKDGTKCYRIKGKRYKEIALEDLYNRHIINRWSNDILGDPQHYDFSHSIA